MFSKITKAIVLKAISCPESILEDITAGIEYDKNDIFEKLLQLAVLYDRHMRTLSQALSRFKSIEYRTYNKEFNAYKRNQYFFDSDRQQILKDFALIKCKVIKKMFRVWIKKYPNETIKGLAKRGIYLGLPVVTFQFFSWPYKYLKRDFIHYFISKFLDAQINLVWLERLYSKVKRPDNLYYMFDVADGYKISGADKFMWLNEMIARNSHPDILTVEEGLAFCLHTDVLSRHAIVCAGSRGCDGDPCRPAYASYPSFYGPNSGSNSKGKIFLDCRLYIGYELAAPTCESRGQN